ncbi:MULTISPECIES: hypothetical protein [unclassified Moritella]|uniref:hypothetical protein n=1 Tax=unclassified Moritella TaxID=2637987 RepID=UPI001BA6E719|nr:MULTISPECIES: hypothetical protein [unclassified Moritella]QUM85702.1 hypothetical protein HWV02_14870 [Moritella sp. 28]QUM89918.1 hypothetical protein HWV03_14435 [Moritella sp. 36]
MIQPKHGNDDISNITVLSFIEPHPLFVDIANNDDIDMQFITAQDVIAHDVNLLQSDLIVAIYQQKNVNQLGYLSRRKIIEDNFIATIWLNIDELDKRASLTALRFVNHMATVLNKNQLLKFNISDISSLVSHSKSLRFFETSCEENLLNLAANDTIADSAAMIIVTKDPISIRKINAGFEVINEVFEHEVPCFYGVHMSPKYNAKHTYLYLVGER